MISYNITLFLIPAAQFIVHVRAPGVVALQNRKQRNLYLCIKPGELTHGEGNSECNLKVKDNGVWGHYTVSVQGLGSLYYLATHPFFMCII